jgi:hypothetical protein
MGLNGDMHEEHHREDHENNIEGVTETGAGENEHFGTLIEHFGTVVTLRST